MHRNNKRDCLFPRRSCLDIFLPVRSIHTDKSVDTLATNMIRYHIYTIRKLLTFVKMLSYGDYARALSPKTKRTAEAVLLLLSVCLRLCRHNLIGRSRIDAERRNRERSCRNLLRANVSKLCAIMQAQSNWAKQNRCRATKRERSCRNLLRANVSKQCAIMREQSPYPVRRSHT